MKKAKDKRSIIAICISLIIFLLAVSIIGIISREIQTNTELSTELTNVNSNNSTLTETYAEWANAIGGDSNDTIMSVIATTDGGYLVGGYFTSSSIDLGNDVSITTNGGQDGMVIKYNSSGVAQWAKTIGGTSSDYITSVIATTDGGYLVGGYSQSMSIDLGNNISISKISGDSDSQDGILIKYNSSGVAQWAKAIAGTNHDVINSLIATTDGGCLVGGYFTSSSIDLGNGVSITTNGGQDGMVIKYNSSGVAQWAKTIGGTSSDYISSVITTNDEGYLVGGCFSSTSIDLGNNVSISTNGGKDGMIIKYNSSGVAQWAKTIGGTGSDYINSVITTNDGGYLVGGACSGGSINLEDDKTITNPKPYSVAMIVKYNSQGTTVWGKVLSECTNSVVNSILQTQDGGFLLGIVWASNPSYIIKCDSLGEVQWEKSISSSAPKRPNIASIVATTDGGYLVVGDFSSTSINLGNNVSISNHHSTSDGTYTSDGMLIKFRDTVAPTVSISTTPNGSTSTSNGYAKSRSVTITIEDEGGSGLSNNNLHKYYLSESSTELSGGTWTEYMPGEEFTIGTDKSGTYYLFVRTVSDTVGNLSIGLNSTNTITIENTEYHMYSTAILLDNTPPTAGTMTMKLGNSEGLEYTNNTWTNQNVYIELNNGSDEHSGHKATTYSVSGSIKLDNQTEATTLTEEGTYTITVTTTDNIGLTSTNSYTVKIDKTLPTAGTLTMKLDSREGATYTNDTWTNQNVYIEAVNGEDTLSGNSTAYSISGAITLENQEEATTLTEEGTYTITVTTTDDAGNTATSEEYTVKIDKTLPIAGTIAMKLEGSEGVEYTNDTWTNQSVYIELNNGLDEYSGHKETTYSVSGSTTINNQTEEMTLTEEGTYTIIVTTTDNAGNTSTNTYTIKIDKTPPIAGALTMKLDNNEGATYTNDTWTNQNVYIEAVDGSDKYSGHKSTTYSVSGRITLENQEGATVLTETGIYTITVTTTDNMENTSTNSYTVKIDKVVPTLTVNPTSGEYAKTREITIIVEDEGEAELSNSNSYQYYLSKSNTTLTEGEWKTYQSGTAFTIGEGKTGTYYLFIKKITDNAGNINTVEGIEETAIEGIPCQIYGAYYFDNTAPIITKIELVNNVVKIEANDTNEENSGLSKYRYITSREKLTNPTITTENSTEAETTGEITITNINEVRYIYALVEDMVGNTSEIAEIEVPQITLEGQVNLETEERKGGVDLIWQIGGQGEKTYKIYQKDGAEDQWKEINTTNELSMTTSTSKDIAAPNAPTIKVNEIDEEDKINISQTTTDNGSTYTFYATACDSENNNIVLSTSEEITKEIKTGVKGYYYILTDTLDSEFDIEKAIYTEEENIRIDLEHNGQYIRMKAVDIAGNISEEANTQIYITTELTVNLDGGTLNGETGITVITGLAGKTIELGEAEKEGYTFIGWKVKVLIEHGTQGTIVGTKYTFGRKSGEVTAIYDINYYGYKIEYYYAGIKDESKTKTGIAEYSSIIDKYPEEPREGYILGTTENYPLTIKVEAEGWTLEEIEENSSAIVVREEEIENNIIKINYEKRTDLEYTINYLEEGTNKVIHEPKEAKEQTFEEIITAEEEIIEIPGYYYARSDKENITIAVDKAKNIINLYYTKRNDLTYTIKYLEKGTEKELHEQKLVPDQLFESTVDIPTEERIEIEGYNYDSMGNDPITITAYDEENIVKIYYTKRNDLSYTIKYLEQGTNEEIHESITIYNQTFEDVIIAKEQAIEIDGYYYDDSIEQETLTIGTKEEENIINVYYTRRKDLKYTINYLDEYGEKIAEPREVENQEYRKVIIAQEIAIEIEGHTYDDSIEQETLTIGTKEEENIINIYYIKRSDLKYTINYLDKETGEVIHEAKETTGVYGGIITAEVEMKEIAEKIPGYTNGTPDKEDITIGINEEENVINIYYEKRTDILYKIEYYYSEIRDDSKTTEGTATYLDVIEEYEDKVIEGYKLAKVEKMPLTIEADEEMNIIKVYYAKETQVTVKYLNSITNEVIDEETIEGYVGKEIQLETKNFKNYVLVEEPEEKTITMTEEGTTIRYYYIYVSKGVIEKHVDIDTGELLQNTTYEGYEGDTYKTEPREIEGYDFIEEYPENSEGIMEKDAITVTYYYKKKETITVTVKYIDKETQREIIERIVIEGYDGKGYTTEQKNISGYEFVNIVGKQEGTMTENIEVVYYYQKVKVPDNGNGGNTSEGEMTDTTMINAGIPSAGMSKQVITATVFVVIALTAVTLVVFAIKAIITYKKYKM